LINLSKKNIAGSSNLCFDRFVRINICANIYIYTFIFICLIFCAFPHAGWASDFDFQFTSTERAAKTVMIIALDSRPANMLYPELICKIAGFKPLFPPGEFMDNFQKPADTQKIARWMVENADKADAFIISSTMLCYGGLIASRTPAARLYDALKNLRHIETIKLKYPHKPVFVYDIIQRLAVTAASEEELEYYKLVRQWAILEDKAETAPEKGDARERDTLRSKIPQSVFDNYIKARKRNNAVNIKVVQMCAAGFIDCVILGQDDASKYGIHKKEARALSELASNIKLGGRFNIFPGADEIDAVLIARLASYFNGRAPSYFVMYPNAETFDWIAPYEDIKISENIKRHIEAAGSKLCGDSLEADIILALNATAETEFKRNIDMVKTADEIARLINEGKLVAAADLSYANRSDTAFVELLVKKTDISALASYSAWNTAGNKLGFAIGQASARWHSLNFVLKELSESCAKAHYEFLLLRFVKDYCYKNFVIKPAEEYISRIGADRFNLKESKDKVEKFISSELKPMLDNWAASYFIGKKAVLSFNGIYYKSPQSGSYYIAGVKNVKITLPWPRIFECKIEFELDLTNIK